MQEVLNILKMNIPSIISFIGIIISYFGIKSSYKNDLKKIKAEKVYDKIETLPYEIVGIMNNLFSSSAKESISDDLSVFMNKVVAYCSADAVKIACYIEQIAYGNDDIFKMLVGFSLLVTQLKYDLSAVIISPEYYFLINTRDYPKHQDEIVGYINSIVKELNLKKEFYVKNKE